MLDKKRESEFDLYLQAGARLIEQGDYSQAEKILKSGLKKLEQHLSEQEMLRDAFLSNLETLHGKASSTRYSTGEIADEVAAKQDLNE
ncbi:MAG: hypothetical protein K2Y32_04015 [Candidatus Obscuribacterales bacterium]|nr:hypothetical protein [Candidatus Obscuribacterales bacterium]